MCASARGPSDDTSRPCSQYWPLVGRSRQPTRYMNVDLPDPDAPVSITNSRGITSIVTPRSARPRPSPRSYVLLNSRTLMMGVFRASLIAALLAWRALSDGTLEDGRRTVAAVRLSSA